MTTYLGSVKAMPGHILIKKRCMLRSILNSKLWLLERTLISQNPTPCRFWFHKGTYYYVNGRKQVYETDIDGENVVVFNPVCLQLVGETYHEVNFRLLDKVEWVFL